MEGAINATERIRDVSESFKDEFMLGETNEFVNTGPPPIMKRRRLIFDSIRTIIEKGGGQGAGATKRGEDDRGRYVYVFGAGYHGQLGRKAARGHKKYANIPIPVQLTEPVRQIACGALHTAVVTDEGKVLTWGDGRMGQLGHLQEGFSNQPVPTVVSHLSGSSICHIACGQNHTIAVADNGDVFSWGWAKNGQLGLGHRANYQRYPAQIKCDNTEFKGIKQVACGDRHTVCVTKSGLCFAFGSGGHGQLGMGDSQDCFSPKQVMALRNHHIKQTDCGAIHTAVITEDGRLFTWGFGENIYGKGKKNFNYEPIPISFKHRIAQVACGQSHILILTEVSKDVYSWGGGTYGEIGQGAFKASQLPKLVLYGKNIASIAAGRYHSSAVSNVGALYTWGCGDNGQLGRPQDKQDNNSKRATSIPKLVISLLGNVTGEIACGEHHTCVLASCRYTSIADDVAEWGKLEEMEYQFKLNILNSSKQKGRGISKKDLVRIRKWRREEENRKKKKQELDESMETKKIEKEVSKIAINESLRSQAEENLKKKQQHAHADLTDKQDTLPPIPTLAEGPRPPRRDRNLQRSASMQAVGQRGRRNMARSQSSNVLHVTAKAANNSRSNFHEYGAQFLGGMSQAIYQVRKPGGTTVQRDEYLRNKFACRKEYDKLRLVTTQKEIKLRKLDEELAMLQEADDCSEEVSQTAEMQLKRLGMKLSTVMIKISEAERSRKTYELNIVHIKDESQENHKQLDALRRNLFYQENLHKKILKFKDYAMNQRDLATLGVKEFEAEIKDWKNFLNFQYKNLSNITKGRKEQESQHALTRVKKKQEKKRQKRMHRISKLQKLVDTNDLEMSRLEEKRNKLEKKIEYFENRFQKIQEATGLSDPEKIISKFFVNMEIDQEQTKVLQDREHTRTSVTTDLGKLEDHLKVLSSASTEHSWREVDVIQEKLQSSLARLQHKKEEADKLATNITQLKEWIHSVILKIDQYLSVYDLKLVPAVGLQSPIEVIEALKQRIFMIAMVIEDLASGGGRFTKMQKEEIPAPKAAEDESSKTSEKRKRRKKR